MTEEPSERLIEQRLRNRIFEILEILADCEAGAGLVGIRGYFDLFEDFVHRHSTESGKPVLSKDERLILLEIAGFLEAARESNADFHSPWPTLIGAKAREARAMFVRRGLFCETFEQDEPEQPAQIPVQP